MGVARLLPMLQATCRCQTQRRASTTKAYGSGKAFAHAASDLSMPDSATSFHHQGVWEWQGFCPCCKRPVDARLSDELPPPRLMGVARLLPMLQATCRCQTQRRASTTKAYGSGKAFAHAASDLSMPDSA